MSHSFYQHISRPFPLSPTTLDPNLILPKEVDSSMDKKRICLTPPSSVVENQMR